MDLFLESIETPSNQVSKPLTFISIQGKGLDNAVINIFLTSTHILCFRHLYKNSKKHGLGEST